MAATVCWMFASVGQSTEPSLEPLLSWPFCEPGAAWRSRMMTPKLYSLRIGYQPMVYQMLRQSGVAQRQR
jgi:hypothetical protein